MNILGASEVDAFQSGEVKDMPGFDGRGPMGFGPLTGRGMGYCAVRLPSPEIGGRPYLFTRLTPAGEDFFYAHQGLAYHARTLVNRFGPGPFRLGIGHGHVFRYGRDLGPRLAPFGP